MKAVYVDEKIVSAIIHKEEHMYLGLMPKAIRDIRFISTTGKEMSIQDFFDYYKDSIHIIAEYLKVAQQEEINGSI